MSLTDPTATRSWRVTVCAVLAVALLADAGWFGWGCTLNSFPNGAAADARGTATVVGLFASFPLIFGLAFGLPARLRFGDDATSVLLVIFGSVMTAVGVGFTIGRFQLPVSDGHRPGAFNALIPVFFASGIGLLAAAYWVRAHRLHSQHLAAYLAAKGVHVDGLVTLSAMTGEVNKVPRWKVVVKYTDAQGTTRFVTKHVTGFGAPPVDSHVSLSYDPAKPGDQHRIVVDA